MSETIAVSHLTLDGIPTPFEQCSLVLDGRLDPTSPHRIAEATGHDREIVIVCNEGYASSLAAATLQQLGLRRATDLDGGFQAVLAARPASPARPSSPPASHR